MIVENKYYRESPKEEEKEKPKIVKQRNPEKTLQTISKRRLLYKINPNLTKIEKKGKNKLKHTWNFQFFHFGSVSSITC